MAVKLSKQARRYGVMALAISALTLPGMAMAEPEDGGNGGRRAQSEEGSRQARVEQRQEARQEQRQQVREQPPQRAEPRAQQAAPQQQPAQQNGGNRQGRSWSDANRAIQQQQTPAPSQNWNRERDRNGDRQASNQGGTSNRDSDHDDRRAANRGGGGRNWTDANRPTRDRVDWRERGHEHADQKRYDDRRNRNGGYVSGGNYYGSTTDAAHEAHDRYHHQWDRLWRSNISFNWYSYRSSHPSYYRLGTYYSPYRNYSYRRLNIGFFLDNLFFGQNYWIGDPRYYRLPDVYGPYRWVRYYDDAVLVDIYSGEVVDVIYDFFW